MPRIRALASASVLSIAPALFCLAGHPLQAQDDGEVMDLSDRITPSCELIGLVALPPEGWFSLPMEETPAGSAGCHMMRTDETQEVVGIVRLRSTQTGETPPGEASVAEIITRELEFHESLGYTLGDPLWARQDVPIQGAGFSAARAVGLPLTVPEAGSSWELHLLSFQSQTVQYLFSLVTPSKTLAPEDYQRNTDDFGVLIRTLDQPLSSD